MINIREDGPREFVNAEWKQSRKNSNDVPLG